MKQTVENKEGNGNNTEFREEQEIFTWPQLPVPTDQLIKKEKDICHPHTFI